MEPHDFQTSRIYWDAVVLQSGGFRMKPIHKICEASWNDDSASVYPVSNRSPVHSSRSESRQNKHRPDKTWMPEFPDRCTRKRKAERKETKKNDRLPIFRQTRNRQLFIASIGAPSREHQLSIGSSKMVADQTRIDFRFKDDALLCSAKQYVTRDSVKSQLLRCIWASLPVRWKYNLLRSNLRSNNALVIVVSISWWGQDNDHDASKKIRGSAKAFFPTPLCAMALWATDAGTIWLNLAPCPGIISVVDSIVNYFKTVRSSGRVFSNHLRRCDGNIYLYRIVFWCTIFWLSKCTHDKNSLIQNERKEISLKNVRFVVLHCRNIANYFFPFHPFRLLLLTAPQGNL